MIRCISLQEEGRTLIFPSLGDVIPTYLFYFFKFHPPPLRKAVKVEGSQEGICRDQAQPRAAWR